MYHRPDKRGKEKRPDIDSIYDFLSRTEASDIDKVSIELVLNEVIKRTFY